MIAHGVADEQKGGHRRDPHLAGGLVRQGRFAWIINAPGARNGPLNPGTLARILRASSGLLTE
jgi:hypothetical protein